MSWIRSEQSLQRHPKTLLLQSLLSVEPETVIGRLHMLWWWCLDYALDGNLTKHPAEVIKSACNIPLQDLITAKFVDDRPYLRIHDWWQNQGNYLKIRFKDQPEKWRYIETLYERRFLRKGIPKGNTTRNSMDVRTYEEKREDVRDVTVSAKSKDSLTLFKPAEWEEPGPDPLEKMVKAGRVKVK